MSLDQIVLELKISESRKIFLIQVYSLETNRDSLKTLETRSTNIDTISKDIFNLAHARSNK